MQVTMVSFRCSRNGQMNELRCGRARSVTRNRTRRDLRRRRTCQFASERSRTAYGFIFRTAQVVTYGNWNC